MTVLTLIDYNLRRSTAGRIDERSTSNGEFN